MPASAANVMRITVFLVAFAAAVPAGVYWYETHQRELETREMLDVSVSLRTVSHVWTDRLGDSVWEPGLGSGFLVSSADCEVWTNHHVIANAALIEVFPTGWTGGSGIPAEVVNSNPRGDIAILRMEHCDGIPEARLGDSDRVRPGDDTYAVGNPLGKNPNSISRGIISHTERYARGVTPFLQTDAAINPGNSGGALFNSRGEVIGVNTGLAPSYLGLNIGIGYAVPINVVKEVAAELRSGPPSWGSAGLAEVLDTLPAETAELFGVPGGAAAVIVTRAPTEGPSADALLARDVIYQIGDAPVAATTEATRLISSYRPGETVRFHIIRDGESRGVDITLGEGWEEDEARTAEPFAGYLGMKLESWAGEEDERGMFARPVITKIHSLGPAHKAQLASSQHGFSNRGPFVVPFQLDVKTITGLVYDGRYHPVEDVEDVEDFAVAAYQSAKPLLLEVEHWLRENPMDVASEFQHAETKFYRLHPAVSGTPPAPRRWHPVSNRPPSRARGNSA